MNRSSAWILGLVISSLTSLGARAEVGSLQQACDRMTECVDDMSVGDCESFLRQEKLLDQKFLACLAQGRCDEIQEGTVFERCIEETGIEPPPIDEQEWDDEEYPMDESDADWEDTAVNDGREPDSEPDAPSLGSSDGERDPPRSESLPAVDAAGRGAAPAPTYDGAMRQISERICQRYADCGFEVKQAEACASKFLEQESEDRWLARFGICMAYSSCASLKSGNSLGDVCLTPELKALQKQLSQAHGTTGWILRTMGEDGVKLDFYDQSGGYTRSVEH